MLPRWMSLPDDPYANDSHNLDSPIAEIWKVINPAAIFS